MIFKKKKISKLILETYKIMEIQGKSGQPSLQ